MAYREHMVTLTATTHPSGSGGPTWAGKVKRMISGVLGLLPGNGEDIPPDLFTAECKWCPWHGVSWTRPGIIVMREYHDRHHPDHHVVIRGPGFTDGPPAQGTAPRPAR